MVRLAAIEELHTWAYQIPTSAPESDGLGEWNRIPVVLVEIRAGGQQGIGYTFAPAATAVLIRDLLNDIVLDCDAMDIPGIWLRMKQSIASLGVSGIASQAISAVDIALWDLKARLLNLSLCSLLGRVRDRTAAYASGGFTSYSIVELQSQARAWAENGFRKFKMKVGRTPEEDADRVHVVREAIGFESELYVDADGTYPQKQALALAEVFADEGVLWFEDPVDPSDLAGLHLVRERSPAGMNIATGSSGSELSFFHRLLAAECTDILQVDATRACGITGFLKTAALSEAHPLPLATSSAPSLHAHLACSSVPARSVEYFHDHARVEHLLFDGALSPVDGNLHPDMTRAGLGLELKRADLERFASAA